jgi:site-specific recombinase XerD
VSRRIAKTRRPIPKTKRAARDLAVKARRANKARELRALRADLWREALEADRAIHRWRRRRLRDYHHLYRHGLRVTELVSLTWSQDVDREQRRLLVRRLTEAGQRAGLRNVTPALRHACGYELAMKGIDTRRLQIYLGHRSITSTTIYTDLAEHATDSVWAA